MYHNHSIVGMAPRSVTIYSYPIAFKIVLVRGNVSCSFEEQIENAFVRQQWLSPAVYHQNTMKHS